MLGDAPADRSADIKSLERDRDRLRPILASVGAKVEQLEARKRPRNHRKFPDYELHTSQHELARLAGDATRLDDAIASAHAGQHRRSSFLAAHHVDHLALDQIEHILGTRRRENTTRIAEHPPSYIVKSLGQRPAQREQEIAWIRAVVAVEHLRFDRDITSHRTLIGPMPTGGPVDHDWERVKELVGETRLAIGLRGTATR